jgi:tRNA 2-thiouridine synthesizing protein A
MPQDESIKTEILVDARGHRCPVPTLRLRRAWESAPPGAVLRLLADDPLARIDAPHFAAQAGLEVLSVEAQGTEIVVLLRKPA